VRDEGRETSKGDALQPKGGETGRGERICEGITREEARRRRVWRTSSKDNKRFAGRERIWEDISKGGGEYGGHVPKMKRGLQE
jgi:hypothetical protein